MAKHFISDIDLNIIGQLYNLKGSQLITTYSLAQKIFGCNKTLDKKQRSRFYTNKANYLEYRMKRLKKFGIIDISMNKDGSKTFSLILNNVRKRVLKYKKLDFNRLTFFINIDGDWDIFPVSKNFS